MNKTKTVSINGDKNDIDVMHRSPARPIGKTDRIVSQPSDTTTNVKFHILIAEDEPMTRKILTLSLERLGYRVTAAKNGLDALVLFDEQHDQHDHADAGAGRVRRHPHHAAPAPQPHRA